MSEIFWHRDFNTGWLLRHHLFVMTGLCLSFRLSDIYHRLGGSLTIGLLADRVNVAIGLIQSEGRIFQAQALGSRKGVLGFCNDITSVGLGLNDVSPGTDNVRG